MPEFGTAYGGSFRRIVQTAGGISIFYDVGQGQGFQRNIVMNGSPHLPAQHPPVVRRLARPLGGRHAGDRRDQFQPEDRLHGLAREPAPGRALDADRARHARVRRHDRGPDGVDAPVDGEGRVHAGRTTRRTGSTTSRAATKATTASRRCCWRPVSRRRRTPRVAARIRPRRTTPPILSASKRIRSGGNRVMSIRLQWPDDLPFGDRRRRRRGRGRRPSFHVP